MTGKKSQNSPVGSPLSGNVSDFSSKEQDRFLPIANVSRIMKKSLPANAKISKEAKETVQECVSEFISFITGEASDKCQREKRKTINGDDLLWAMTTLGFENYVSPLKVYLNKYRENEGDKSSMVREEDQLPPISPNKTSSGHGEVSRGNDPISARPNFQTLSNAYYSLDSKVASKGHGDPGRMIGYGENLMAGAYNIGKIHEIEGSGNRVITTNLHHGIEW
ncbi:nuclear transcription factor Y subunit B-3-like [Coffea arabica]|uniref:Nuclear transcription factor Y subunit B-3-like n=1 Tax=Coffea arabica TaxID=13443 RepID=A0A6P6TDN6_COFAR|nr:nuclear transcription factor Y subunit B-3-like [Coffea arabica]